MKCLKKFMKRMVRIMICLRLMPVVSDIEDDEGVSSSSSDTSLY